MPAGYSYYRTITVQNRSGGTLTDYPVRVHLVAANFTFTDIQADFDDVVFYDSTGTTALKHWFEEKDKAGSAAKAWFKAPSLTSGSNTFRVYYVNGSATNTEDPDNVFSYYNALTTTDDMNALDTTFGTTTWSVVTDAGSPTGNAVDSNVSSGNAHGRTITVTLPTEYVVEVHTAEKEATLGAYPGPLLDCADGDNWYRPAAGGGSTKDVEIQENNATTLTNRDQQTINATLGVAKDAWYKQVCEWRKTQTWSVDSSFSCPSGDVPKQQSITTDGTLVYVSGDDEVVSYNMSGTKQTEYDGTGVPGSAAAVWGDLCIADTGSGALLYAVRWDTSSPKTRVYSFDPTDLSTGPTLVRDISADFATEGNSIAFDSEGHFLVGENSTTTGTNLVVNVYNDDFTTILSSWVYPYGHDTQITGAQCAEFWNETLVVTSHTQTGGIEPVLFFNWDAVAQKADFVAYVDTGIPTIQGLTWDSSGETWIANDRDSFEVDFYSVALHSTSRRAAGAWIDGTKSFRAVEWDVASPFTQAEAGIGAFRDARFSQLFYRQVAWPEPGVSLGAETDAASARSLSAVTRLGGSGFPRPMYGSFAGKAAAEPEPEVVARARGGWLPEEFFARPRKPSPRVKTWLDTERELRVLLQAAYEDITGEGPEEPIAQAAGELAREFAPAQAEVPLPEVAVIDFAAMASSTETAERLLALYERYLDDEEAAVLLLLTI